MARDHRLITAEQITHLCLIQPNGLLFKRYFNLSLAIVGGENPYLLFSHDSSLSKVPFSGVHCSRNPKLPEILALFRILNRFFVQICGFQLLFNLIQRAAQGMLQSCHVFNQPLDHLWPVRLVVAV